MKRSATCTKNYSQALYGVLFKIVNDEEIARDLLQETFVKIWKNISNYDRQKGRLFTWMLNVARNTAIDTLRSKAFKTNNQNQDIENVVNIVDAQMNTSSQVDHIGLKEVVGKLKVEQQQIIDLLYFNGYTQEEAAKELNLPLGTVKTRSRSAIMQLRQLLNLK